MWNWNILFFWRLLVRLGCWLSSWTHWCLPDNDSFSTSCLFIYKLNTWMHVCLHQAEGIPPQKPATLISCSIDQHRAKVVARFVIKDFGLRVSTAQLLMCQAWKVPWLLSSHLEWIKWILASSLCCCFLPRLEILSLQLWTLSAILAFASIRHRGKRQCTTLVLSTRQDERSQSNSPARFGKRSTSAPGGPLRGT